jgi:protein-L-isoaspartate(D-aspartate) O-methyltransferase
LFRIFQPVTSIAIVGILSSQLIGQALDRYESTRHKMVEDAVVSAGVKNPRVISSLKSVPRHEFVAITYRPKAYLDMALPIGEQQTISSPFIVAYMTESLNPQSTDKVLEIGSGSGYQAAVLSPLVKEVYTIEILAPLGNKAKRTLKRLGYDNVEVKVGDGFKGWPEHAPFDKIIVTCSPEKVPQPLADQLAEGGLMVIPVGERYQQTLVLYKKEDGKLIPQPLRPTLFVPMTGAAEDNREVKPDPKNPKIVNGDFEIGPAENGFVEGWYYQRQMTWEKEDGESAQPNHFVRFKNEEEGLHSHLLQGFAIDGLAVEKLVVSAKVRYDGIYPPPGSKYQPSVAVSFYDEVRRDLGTFVVGPFKGKQPWHTVEKECRVPPKTREAIIRIGLYGEIGQLDVDDVQISIGN